MSGPQPPPADHKSPEDDDTVRKLIQLTYHPAFEELSGILRVPFPTDLRLLFELSASTYNVQRGGWFPVLAARGGDQRVAYGILHDDVQEGLRSCHYHLGNFLRIEDEVKRLGHQLHRMLTPASGTSLGMSAESLNSEWEAFTFMSRATLDRLAGLLMFGMGVDLNPNLLKLGNWLRKNQPQAPETTAYSACLDRHHEYMQTQFSDDKSQRLTERDRIAHFRRIQFAGVNVMWLADGTLAVWTTSDPMTGHDAGRLLASRFYELTDLVIDLVVTFVGLDHYWGRSPRPRPR